MKVIETQSLNIRLRPALTMDAQALGDFGSQLVALHHAFDPRRFLKPKTVTADGYARFLVRKMAEDDALVIAADEGGRLLGYVYAEIEGFDYMSLRGPAGVLHDIFVDPDRRRQGLGRQLLEAALSAMEERNCSQIVLSTAHRNMAAQKLFAAYGFRPTMLEMTRQTNLSPLTRNPE